MRKLNIIESFDYIKGKRFANWLKQTGFVNDRKIGPIEIAMLAGWPSGTDVCILDSVTDDRKEAVLLGNPDYGTKEGTYESIGPQRLVPLDGQTWVKVLGERLYLS